MKKDGCPHTSLTVLDDAQPKLRCRHCHLTIDADELSDSYCPECFESTGCKRFDFEDVSPANRNIRYRCEACGLLIENEPPD